MFAESDDLSYFSWIHWTWTNGHKPTFHHSPISLKLTDKTVPNLSTKYFICFPVLWMLSAELSVMFWNQENIFKKRWLDTFFFSCVSLSATNHRKWRDYKTTWTEKSSKEMKEVKNVAALSVGVADYQLLDSLTSFHAIQVIDWCSSWTIIEV